ncbi:MAG: S1 RNA-binding domain-containing protein, partial [Victivallales bacterium]|nr:S1 RNA-binding domain-containing protein [Victivallales bacterium]
MANHIDLENMSSMEDLLQKSGNADINEDKIVNGRVAEKNDKGILLDIGFKAEAFIDKAELGEKWDTVKTGDMLEVYLEQMEDEENVPSVSLHKAELQKSWDSIEQNYKEGDLIKGTIKSRVKGGLIVDVGVEAFLP